MTVLTRLDHSDVSWPTRCGGKAAGLAALRAAGLPAPESYCLPVEIYLDFVAGSGLAEVIAYELGRKDFGTMRWEELWDAALRLRRHFVATPWPAGLEAQLRRELDAATAGWEAVAVRSSAADEDGSAHSFAGLHDSRIMLHNTDQVLAAVRVVWASLWSDGALLYRRELGLDPERSGMAVVIQEMIVGECSGVLFTVSPRGRGHMMVEAVWGLNQALVDGSLAPWRWELDRETGRPVRFEAVEQSTSLQPAVTGTGLAPLPPEQAGRPPLTEVMLIRLAELGRRAEQLVGGPADVEWTCRQGEFVLLQVRPITTGADEADPRRWYLSLHRSLESLEHLREELEGEILPGMQAAAEQMDAVDLASLEDAALVEELTSRYRSLDDWTDVYHDKCIPMAHGIRLFGEYYTDRIQPDDPYAFVDLLRSVPLLAVERNRRMLELAAMLKRDRKLLRDLRGSGRLPEQGAFAEKCRDLIRSFGSLDWISGAGLSLADWLVRLAESERELQPEQASVSGTVSEAEFLAGLDKNERSVGRRLLAIGRASYALRDNDNLSLGRIRAEVYAAEAEVRRRAEQTGGTSFEGVLRKRSAAEVVAARPAIGANFFAEEEDRHARARQLVGQPAVPGMVRGAARVLQRGAELASFRPGEVLVCDAIEPNMTFLVPVAAAIVERRGGMLIHGAIIAREYGIPCVTGVPDATVRIRSGDLLTVDGYLGIVTIDRPVD